MVVLVVVVVVGMIPLFCMSLISLRARRIPSGLHSINSISR
jgi:hypothetical protein